MSSKSGGNFGGVDGPINTSISALPQSEYIRLRSHAARPGKDQAPVDAFRRNARPPGSEFTQFGFGTKKCCQRSASKTRSL
jgi:hypothetical protein